MSFFSMVSCYKVVHFIFFWSMVILQTADGASVTWYEPPPVETTSDHNIVLTADSRQLPEGSTNVQLSWKFSLTPDLITVDLTLNDVDIATVLAQTGKAGTVLGFEGRFNITWISQRATLIIFNVTEDDDGEFGCKLNTFPGGQKKVWTRKMKVEVVVPVNLTKVSPYNQNVREGSNVTLLCEATGRPKPNITWTRVLESGGNGEVLHQGKTWDFPNINRTASGKYNCTADNGYKKPVSHKVEVNVLFPAKIVKLASEHNVSAQQGIPIHCEAEGNPLPSYTWTPCDPQKSVCNKSMLNFQASNKSIYTFTCKVENNLDTDTRNTTLYIASDLINVTLVIMVEGCTAEEYDQLWKKLSEMINDIFTGKLGYESVHRKNIRCGSVIVDLALKFSSTVRESNVLSILRDAAGNGKFGDFNVSAIRGTRDTGITTTMATTPTSSSGSTTWIIVGVVLGGVFLLAVIGVVAWHVYKKRKCKKRDSKVHNNGPQGEEGGNVKNEGYVEVNRGHEGGNRSSVPPVVYDTAQTGNRGAVQGPPQYAVVDKSKRNPKKKKPGELQYADLAEFSAGQGGPRSSTSPTNCPTEIQYADVNAM